MKNFNINETQLLRERKYLKKEFRHTCRVEVAKGTEKDKNDIMASRTYNSKTFHQLVKKQRNKGNNFISDLYVENEKYIGVTVYLAPLDSLPPGGQAVPGYFAPHPGYLHPRGASCPGRFILPPANTSKDICMLFCYFSVSF